MRALWWLLTSWSAGVMAGLLSVGSGLSGWAVMGEVGLWVLAVYAVSTAEAREAGSPAEWPRRTDNGSECPSAALSPLAEKALDDTPGFQPELGFHCKKPGYPRRHVGGCLGDSLIHRPAFEDRLVDGHDDDQL